LPSEARRCVAVRLINISHPEPVIGIVRPSLRWRAACPPVIRGLADERGASGVTAVTAAAGTATIRGDGVQGDWAVQRDWAVPRTWKRQVITILAPSGENPAKAGRRRPAAWRELMAKGQKKSNKEARKPKAEKPKTNASNPSTKGMVASIKS
jgi:hypothetical protein